MLTNNSRRTYIKAGRGSNISVRCVIWLWMLSNWWKSRVYGMLECIHFPSRTKIEYNCSIIIPSELSRGALVLQDCFLCRGTRSRRVRRRRHYRTAGDRLHHQSELPGVIRSQRAVRCPCRRHWPRLCSYEPDGSGRWGPSQRWLLRLPKPRG